LGATVLGAYRKMRHSEHLSERLTRQELLGRLFELRARLQNPHRTVPEGVVPEAVYRSFNKHPWILSGLAGALAALISTSTMAMFDYSPQSDTRPPDLWLLSSVFIFILGLCLNFAIGFLSRSWVRAVGYVLVAWVADQAVVRSGIYGDRLEWMRVIGQENLILNLGAMAMVGIVGAMASRVEAAAVRERRLVAKDPAALLAEIVKIEWRLSQGAAEVCVVVVDAARSAEMKATGDPLDAEYSFREYQKMLAFIARSRNGEVHSTAGDGAVLTFECAEDAFAAARAIQCDIDKFNREVNRLAMPFRLRVGIHMGEVPGDIEEVQFTQVIDIAAHVQSRAPVGGILATQAVAARLSGESFAPLAEAVDGQPVLLALDPTGCGRSGT
jgi:class 3 adenylate cyclase